MSTPDDTTDNSKLVATDTVYVSPDGGTMCVRKDQKQRADYQTHDSPSRKFLTKVDESIDT